MPCIRFAHRALGPAFYALSLVLSVAACSDQSGGQPDLGATPDLALSPDLLPPALPALTLAAPTIWNTYACARFTATAVDAGGRPAAVSSPTPVMLGGLGSAKSFATLGDCQGDAATTTLTLAQGQSSVDFYLRTATSAPLTLSATAAGYLPARLSAAATLFEVLGQPDAQTILGVALGESAPQSVSVAGGKLLLADPSANRVLVWNHIPASSSILPDLVLGQAGNSTTDANFGGAVTGANMTRPEAALFDGTRLFVFDAGNNRVLVWKSFPTANGQPADFALGQPAGAANLTSNSANSGGVSGSSLSSLSANLPFGIAVSGTRLFVADKDNHRVLVWNTVPTAPTPADFALGQPAGAANLTSNTANNGGLSAASLSSPAGLWVQGNQLFVVDYGNNRVLAWKTLPTAPTPADFALGQPAGAANLTSGAVNNGGLTGGGLKSPTGVSSDGTRLWVSDLGNNRVLAWNSLPSAVVPADFVLGQMSFANNTAGGSATAVSSPGAAFSDGAHLFVADSGNHRTLVYNTLPTTSGAPASYALGQSEGAANLTTVISFARPVSGAALYNPNAMDSDGKRLFLVDTLNSRVLVWNQFPQKPDQPADFALGQPAGGDNLTSHGAPSPPTAESMNQPSAVALVGGHLFVADSANNRVLAWNTVPTAPTPADFALGQPAGATNLTSRMSNNGGVSGASMSFCLGLATDGTSLFVGDTGNSRVLVFKQLPTAPVAADFALGQPAGAKNLSSAGGNNGGLSPASLQSPALLFSDGKLLTVADTGNNRVLIWSAIPTAAAGADLVLGQNDFSHGTAGTSAQTLSQPWHAITDGTRFFVSDSANSRILVWDPLPTTSGQPATAVIGQVDFRSKGINRSGPLSDQGLNFPAGLWADATRLFIQDAGNDRALIVPTH